MLDKHHLEGWVMAWDLVGQYLEMPFSKELFQMALEIVRPWGSPPPPPCNFNLIVKGGRGSLPPPPPSTKVRGVTVFL